MIFIKMIKINRQKVLMTFVKDYTCYEDHVHYVEAFCDDLLFN